MLDDSGRKRAARNAQAHRRITEGVQSGQTGARQGRGRACASSLSQDSCHNTQGAGFRRDAHSPWSKEDNGSVQKVMSCGLHTCVLFFSHMTSVKGERHASALAPVPIQPPWTAVRVVCLDPQPGMLAAMCCSGFGSQRVLKITGAGIGAAVQCAQQCSPSPHPPVVSQLRPAARGVAGGKIGMLGTSRLTCHDPAFHNRAEGCARWDAGHSAKCMR